MDIRTREAFVKPAHFWTDRHLSVPPAVELRKAVLGEPFHAKSVNGAGKERVYQIDWATLPPVIRRVKGFF